MFLDDWSPLPLPSLHPDFTALSADFLSHWASRLEERASLPAFTDDWLDFAGVYDSPTAPTHAESATMLMASNEEEPIIVTGTRPYQGPTPYDPGTGGSGTSSDSGGGGGGSYSGEGPSLPVADPTPCVETTFKTTNASLSAANNAALAASQAIAARNDETYEYSSIIYSSNGQVGWTQPTTQQLTDRVNWTGGLDQVPSGAVIIGIVHNHPDEPGITDTIPSGAGSERGDDWDRYYQLVNWNSSHVGTANDLPRGISVDPNMLLYIYSDEDGQTHVYDNTDKSQTSPSCSL